MPRQNLVGKRPWHFIFKMQNLNLQTRSLKNSTVDIGRTLRARRRHTKFRRSRISALTAKTKRRRLAFDLIGAASFLWRLAMVSDDSRRGGCPLTCLLSVVVRLTVEMNMILLLARFRNRINMSTRARRCAGRPITKMVRVLIAVRLNSADWLGGFSERSASRYR